MTQPTLLERLRRINQRTPRASGREQAGAPSDAPGEGDMISTAKQGRAEAIQRLQIGLFGIGAMVLLVGLASIIGSQADLADEAAVPDAAPTTEPSPAPSKANPLADAGVVPDITLEPSPSPSPTPLDLPPPVPARPDDAAPRQ